MSETRRTVIKRVLDDFFGVTKEINDSVSGGLTVDETDTEILTEAIDQALEKENVNESPNQPQ